MRAPDDYEAHYMAGDGVIYRDKMKAPKLFFAILLVPMLIQLVALVAVALAPAPLPLGVYLPFPFTVALLALIGLLFSVLRVTVTQREVYVQYGLFGPKIPIEQIVRAEAVAYDWKQYGGWGIRRARDGSWAYNMMGDAGRAVRIVWSDGKGGTNTTLVASSDPEALARAIQVARGGKRIVAAPAGAKARVAPIDAEFQAEADAEVEAILHEDDEKRGA
ncbi:MAG: DUF3093 family protein [Polyangiaceae bacterium]